MRLLRALALSPALLAACDQAVDQRADADASDASSDASFGALEGSGYIASRRAEPAPAREAALPVIAAPRAARTSATLAAADRAATYRALDPILGLVPGLVDSLAAGALAQPADGLVLPAGLAELTGAPWLLLDGRLVLAQGLDVAAEWSAGLPTLATKPAAESDGLYVARRPLARQNLPSTTRALVGATVKVFDREREVCVARVADLALEARLVHSADAWDDASQKFVRVDHDATAVFELGLPTLVASLEPVIGTAADCGKGLWAAPVAAARPSLFRVADMDKALAKPAVRAFRKLPAWQERQHEFATFYSDEPPEKGRWDAAAKHTFARWLADDGRREVLAVSADTWDGCGSNGQRLTALFDVVRDGDAVTFAPLASRAWEGAPDGLVDLEDDGALELVSGTTLYRWHDDRPAGSEANGWRDERYEEVERVEVPDLTAQGCGC